MLKNEKERMVVTTDISKKEAATLSAAIAAYLSKPPSSETSAAFELQKPLELLLEKVVRLENRMEELSLSVNEIKERVERMEK